MIITIKLAGVDRTNWLFVDSCRITKQVNGRASLSAVLQDRGRGYRPYWGMPILVEQGGEKVFTGHITAPIVEKEFAKGDWLYYEIQGKDLNAIPDRRLITAHFLSPAYFTATVQSILANYLVGEGITGYNISKEVLELSGSLTWNQCPVSAALNDISTMTGYSWYIDDERDLHFGPADSFALAPYNIASTVEDVVTGGLLGQVLFGEEPLGGVGELQSVGNRAHYKDLVISRGNPQYRNRQFVRTEYEVQPVYTDVVYGDGVSRVFYLGFPPTENPVSVTLDGVPQTVGNLGIDTGKQWYWVPNSKAFLNLNPEPILGVGAALEVQYVSQYSNTAMDEDTEEQSARAALEGGSGIYEAIEEQRNIDSYDCLKAIATGRLRRSFTDYTKITFRTYAQGFAPGQLLQMSLGNHAINGTFLIDSVEYWWRAAKGDFFECTVNCTNTDSIDKPISYFRKLAEMARIGPGGNKVVATDLYPISFPS